jgi:hypothetical protein
LKKYKEREIEGRDRDRDRGEKQRDRADNKNPKQSWVAQLVCFDLSNAYCNSKYFLYCPTELCHFPNFESLSTQTSKN